MEGQDSVQINSLRHLSDERLDVAQQQSLHRRALAELVFQDACEICTGTTSGNAARK